MRLLCELSNLNTQFLSLSLQITDQLLNPSQFRFEGASGCRSVPAHVPRVSSRRLKLLSKHDQVLFQSRVLGHRLLEFLKEREKRGKIIPRSWHVIVVIVVVVVRQAKVDDTSKTEIYLFLCFSFIYLEEYRLYLETMNGTIKSNFFLRTISLLFIYIYILFREENPDYFSLWKKFFILFEEWNERKVLDWIRVSLNSSDRKYARNRFNFYRYVSCSKIKILRKRIFFFTKRGFTLTGQSKMIQTRPTFELCANNTLTLLSSFSNRSCCFLYLSASAKLLLLPCSLCRRPPRAFSRISCKSRW